jgi:release factor glutamine methyltransferase
MEKVNPELNKKLLDEIKNQDSRVILIDGLKIKTSRNVFPPQSSSSNSSRNLHKFFGDISGKTVLDIGTGTGVQAMQAIRLGARKAVAVDISDEAISCAKENVKLNSMEDRVKVIRSDLFENVPKEKFDLIIANLPITDFPLNGTAESALYDPEYLVHKRFFKDVQRYLSDSGYIVLTHANFKGEGDFEDLEKIITSYGIKVKDYTEDETLGYKWRYYRLILRHD